MMKHEQLIKRMLRVISLNLIFNLIFNLDSKRCFNEMNFLKIEKILKESPVKKIIPIYDYENYSERKRNIFLNKYGKNKKEKEKKKGGGGSFSPLILYFEKGIKGVFKQKSKIEIFSNIQIYEFSKMMNVRVIPPTVLRVIPGYGEGVVSLFIDSEIENKYNIQKKKKIIVNLDKIKISDFKNFMYLYSHLDLTLSNVIVDKSCNDIISIDNDHTLFPVYTPYGNYDFMVLPSKNNKEIIPFHDIARDIARKVIKIEDFRALSESTVYSFKFDSSISLKKNLMKLQKKMNYYNIFFLKEFSSNVENKTIYFIRDKHSRLWVQANQLDYQFLKNLKANSFSKKLIKNIESLDEEKLRNSIESNLDDNIFLFMDKKKQENFIDSMISSILFKKDTLLEQAL